MVAECWRPDLSQGWSSKHHHDTGNDNSNSPTGLRHAGFASVLPDAPIINVSSDFSPVRKEMEIKQILTQTKPDGIFTSDDLTAILIMKVAQELDIQIPKRFENHWLRWYLLCRELLPAASNDQAATERYCPSLCGSAPQKNNWPRSPNNWLFPAS